MTTDLAAMSVTRVPVERPPFGRERRPQLRGNETTDQHQDSAGAELPMHFLAKGTRSVASRNETEPRRNRRLACGRHAPIVEEHPARPDPASKSDARQALLQLGRLVEDLDDSILATVVEPPAHYP